MENILKPKEEWIKTKEKLKRKFAFLTDNDMLFSEGEKESMLLKIQNKLGKTREELNAIIASL